MRDMTEYGLLQLQAHSGGLRAAALIRFFIGNSDQADASPARMTAEISTSAIAVGLRKFSACLRALLKAPRVSAIASRGSSVNLLAKL
jgi:hypothetical protein